MYIEEIPEEDRYEYTVYCETCCIFQQILTQKIENTHCNTHVYLKCNCGDYLLFILPVG